MSDKATILLVDDDPHVMETLAANIHLDGYPWKILRTTLASEALKILSDEKVDVLVTDIRMPKMNGIELMKEARKVWPDLPVFLLTSEVNLYQTYVGTEIPNGVHEKQPSFESLITEIANLLKKK